MEQTAGDECLLPVIVKNDSGAFEIALSRGDANLPAEANLSQDRDAPVDAFLRAEIGLIRDVHIAAEVVHAAEELEILPPPPTAVMRWAKYVKDKVDRRQNPWPTVRTLMAAIAIV